jgi:hypothetical protein
MSKVKEDLHRLIELCKKHGISVSAFVPGLTAFMTVRQYITQYRDKWKPEEYAEKVEMYQLLEKHFPGDYEKQWKFSAATKKLFSDEPESPKIEKPKKTNIWSKFKKIFTKKIKSNQEYGQYSKSYR